MLQPDATVWHVIRKRVRQMVKLADGPSYRDSAPVEERNPAAVIAAILQVPEPGEQPVHHVLPPEKTDYSAYEKLSPLTDFVMKYSVSPTSFPCFTGGKFHKHPVTQTCQRVC